MAVPEAGYCNKADIRSRLLIASGDTTYDTDIVASGVEAARYIDDRLREYISPNLHTLILKEADYGNCNSSDIGKEVRDDDVNVGILSEYNNTTRTWIVRCNSSVTSIAQDSIVEVYGGSGSGVADANTSVPTEDDEPFIFNQVPLTADDTKIPAQIANICADIGSTIFKRRHMPQQFDEGYWNQGLKKLDDFIKGTFHKGTLYFV